MNKLIRSFHASDLMCQYTFCIPIEIISYFFSNFEELNDYRNNQNYKVQNDVLTQILNAACKSIGANKQA